MRTYLVVALVVSLGLSALSLWGTAESRYGNESSSQIYIHGTPVCVIQRGGEIQATVGACSAVPDESRQGAPYRHSPGFSGPGHPGLNLPPGHPPIGPDDGPIGERNHRRTLI
jgi:hypothetical protein